MLDGTGLATSHSAYSPAVFCIIFSFRKHNAEYRCSSSSFIPLYPSVSDSSIALDGLYDAKMGKGKNNGVLPPCRHSQHGGWRFLAPASLLLPIIPHAPQAPKIRTYSRHSSGLSCQERPTTNAGAVFICTLVAAQLREMSVSL